MKQVIVCGVWFISTLILLVVVHPCCVAAQGQEIAPEFSLNDLHGVHHSLSVYRGKVMVINFWASWCHECVDELPSLNTLYEKYKGRGLIVLGIATDRKRDSVEPLLNRMRVTYPVLLNTVGASLLKQYRIIGLPSTVVIDKNGIIVERTVGRADFGSPGFTNKIESLIDSTIKK
jgi:thiol-disulfide isomerase/thioredoxin